MRRGLIALLIVCFVAVAVIPGCQPAPEETIKIGVIGPIKETEGKDMKCAAMMAVEEINAKGGVLGMPLELVIEDSGATPAEGVSAIEKLIAEGAAVVVGEEKTELALAEQEVMADHKIVFLGCGASHLQLCERVKENYDRYKYWFRVSPVNSNVLGVYVLKPFPSVAGKLMELGIEKPKVAILAEKMVWNEALVAMAERLLPTMGMEYVGTWYISPTATDTKGELLAIKEKGAHIIMTMISEPVGIVFSRQRGELEIPVVPFGINGEAQKKDFWEATRGYGNYEPTMNTNFKPEFKQRYAEKWDRFPTYCAATYDAIYMWAECVDQRAKTLDSDAVVEELEKWGNGFPELTQKFNGKPDGVGTIGAEGTYFEFDETHEPVVDMEHCAVPIHTQWQDGELLCIWPEEIAEAEFQIPPYAIEYWRATGQIP